MTTFLEGLNEVQRRAVTDLEGPVMVIAGPGSGKTRVLTYRLAHLMMQGVRPHNILALTFTNKAAREMTERIGELVGPEVRKVWCGTFHSIFARILRVEAPRIGYPQNFSIYDADDSRSAIAQIIKEMDLNPKNYNPNTLRARISSAKANLITAAAYENNDDVREQDRENNMPETFTIYKRYVQRCLKAGAMDFDDLLLQLYRLLHENPDGVLEKYRTIFRFVLVDEFQDTNFLQYAIIRKLVVYPDSPRNICIVGDDAQSIYSFRGATIKNILDFQKDFPDTRVYKLEQNYRSTPHIVQAANDVITHNNRQIPKEIWTDRESGTKIRLIRCASDIEEGKKIADYILELKNRYHLRNSGIAILYRTNAQSRIFEEHLRRHNIPYKVFGGMSFYQRKEVKDFVAYLRLVVNPLDDEAFRRVINYPKRGIGNSTLDRLAEIAETNNCSFWDATGFLQATPKAMQTINHFRSMVLELQRLSAKGDAYQVANSAFKLSGLSAELKSDITSEGIQRFENAMALLDGIRAFAEQDEEGEEISDDRSLAAYLQTISLISDLDGADETSDFVTLMSVHSAKGLEFDAVLVCGLEENLFPSYMAIRDPEQVDEERRLFYVAITRARHHLILSYAQTRYVFGNFRMCEPSRFIDEIAAERIESDRTPKAVFDLAGGEDNSRKKWVESRPRFTREDMSNFTPCSPEQIQTGMVVRHQKFGRGKVLLIEGSKENRVATIQFGEIDNPQRKIILKYAKLEIVP
ncbi:MAG: ATP-dependent DNA helicase PcrA [Saprospiraceae bacterium]|nr:ATP-dependent DNA helicase PcrA [Saprospiraceae bacterium]